MTQSILIAFICCAMIGCNPFYPSRPTSDQLHHKGWAPNPTITKSSPPLYCYGTLGDKMCYTSPIPGHEERLEGAYYPKIDMIDEPTIFDHIMNDFGY